MTDTDDDDYRAGLRKLRDQLFEAGTDTVDVGQPADRPRNNTVRAEGANPDPGTRFTDQDWLRQFTRQLLNPRLAATDPAAWESLP